MMKKKMWLAGAMAASLLLGACGDKKLEARDINPATEICKICNMSVAAEKYAGQVALANGDYETFDDIGCLMEYYNKTDKKDIGEAFVKDFSGEAWVEVDQAIYVSDKEISTPMSYGVIAFKTTDEAQKFIDSEGKGKIVTFEDVKAMDWSGHA